MNHGVFSAITVTAKNSPAMANPSPATAKDSRTNQSS